MTPSARRPDPFSRRSISPWRPWNERERKRGEGQEREVSSDSILSSSFHQKRPRRDGVFWQELAPPGGELTSQADGYDCHKMARGAITHNLYVRPPSPFLPSSMGPRYYNFATQRYGNLCFVRLRYR